MKTQHTPGPWHITPVIEGCLYPLSRMRSLNTRGMVLAHINANFDGEANARLIAAAPELLAALKALNYWARENTSPRDANSPHVLLVAACAAIDKAEGRS